MTVITPETPAHEPQHAAPSAPDVVNPPPLVQPDPEPVQTPEAPAQPSIDLEAVIADITAFEWLQIRRELDLTAEEIVQDTIAMTLVAACYVGKRETGLLQWDKFKAMTPNALKDFLGVEVTADGEATKSA